MAIDKAGGFWLGTFFFLLIEVAFLAFVKFTNARTPFPETMCGAAPRSWPPLIF